MSQAKLYTMTETYIYFQNWYYSGMNKLLPQTIHTLFHYTINYIHIHITFLSLKKIIKLMFLSSVIIMIVCNGLKVTYRVKRLKMSYVFTMKSNRMMAFLLILSILVQVILFIALVL